MAVSKRTRFEVLRRDDYTCRYCRSTDNPLTIDHVVPVTLGGSDAPDNLVAACKDCNAGKSSATPDQAVVSDVAADAVRWAAAMNEAARRTDQKREREEVAIRSFRDLIWGQWTLPNGSTVPLPTGWEEKLLRTLYAGIGTNDAVGAVRATMSRTAGMADEPFVYFLGVCKHILADRAEAARKIIAEEDSANAN